MSEFKVQFYTSDKKKDWDSFVEKSFEGTFLIKRDFMDYHADRFQDNSLMIYKLNELVAIIPANRVDSKVFSHQGLTYGGFITKPNMSNNDALDLVDSVLNFLKDKSIESLIIKMLPEFYQTKNSHYLEQIFNSNQNTKCENQKVFAVDLKKSFNIHKTKLKHHRKNQNKKFIIKNDDDFETFWNKVLLPRLEEKHNTKPVHTLEEIMLLKSRFPEQIKQFNIYLEGQILAGITIFDKGHVIKSQYGATTQLGEKERALEFLFIELMNKYKAMGSSYFSMGTAVDKSFPLGINVGLEKQKVELGCTTYHQKIYNMSMV